MLFSVNQQTCIKGQQSCIKRWCLQGISLMFSVLQRLFGTFTAVLIIYANHSDKAESTLKLNSGGSRQIPGTLEWTTA